MRRSTSRPSETQTRPALSRVPASAWAFLVALATVFVMRRQALWTPYFWDEVGYYVPNAVSMYRNQLYPIPDLTIPQSYPPLQPLLLVVGWSLLGFSIAVTRVVGFVLSAAAVATTFALGRRLFSTAVGVAAAALTLAAPNFFGQTGFAQPEVQLALFTTAATLALVRGRFGWHAAAVALLLMTKWTAAVALPVFAAYALLTAPTWRDGLRRQLWYVPALVLLAAWLGFFYAQTGSLTSTESRYAQVNLLDNLAAATLASRFVVRLEQLTTYDAAWFVVAPALLAAALWARGRLPADRTTRDGVLLLSGLCTAQLAFLTASGFLLPRYFVPVQPLLAVLGAAAIFRLFPRPVATAWVAAAALLAHLGWYGWFQTPRLLDGSTAYFDAVEAHVRAARWLEANAPDARVAAAWPVVDELREPFLGYVTRPIVTVDLAGAPDARAFDLVVESPAPGLENLGGETAERLGLMRLALFRVGAQEAAIWGRGAR